MHYEKVKNNPLIKSPAGVCSPVMSWPSSDFVTPVWEWVTCVMTRFAVAFCSGDFILHPCTSQNRKLNRWCLSGRQAFTGRHGHWTQTRYVELEGGFNCISIHRILTGRACPVDESKEGDRKRKFRLLATDLEAIIMDLRAMSVRLLCWKALFV